VPIAVDEEVVVVTAAPPAPFVDPLDPVPVVA
jgi:hypothetical protein